MAQYYSWLFGDFDAKCRENEEFFLLHDIKPVSTGVAVDLGCGSGLQSIPMANIGYDVIGIDISEKLLDELITKRAAYPLRWLKTIC